MKRDVTHIVLHCSATPQTTTVASIQNYWRKTLGWKQPGYHHIILPDGTIVDLLPIDQVSNGVAGHNAHSINISYIGGVDAKNNPLDNRTPAQIASQIQLIEKYKAMFPKAIVLGHRDFPGVKKACPSFDVKAWLKSVGLALVAMLLLFACNPAKKVMKNKEQFDKVGEAWSKEHPCVNDTVTNFLPGDTLTIDGGTITDTVFHQIAGDTIIRIEYRTRTVNKIIHDTLVKNIRDTRAEKVLQNELDQANASLTKTTIERNEYKADRDGWRRTVRVIGIAILIIIVGVVGAKLFLRKLI